MKNDQWQNLFSRIVNVINEKKSFSICLPTNPSIDTIAAGTSLYLALAKLGKDSYLACSSDVSKTVNLVGVEKIQKNLVSGGDNLVISFPYTEGAIDKVTWNIEGENFNLIIQPRPGYPRLDPEKVKYSYTGGLVEVIIVIDAPALNTLGEIYSLNQEQFQGKEIINIDRHLTNANYGTINLVNRQASSTSEIIFQLLQYLNLEIDKEIATNLYAGLVSATNNFTSYSVNEKTFETAAQLLRLGAVKKPVSSLRTPMTSSSWGSLQGSYSSPSVSFTPKLSSPTQPSSAVSYENNKKEDSKPSSSAPSDWLKPKIFRGGDLI